jgi:hypothetical protein
MSDSSDVDRPELLYYFNNIAKAAIVYGSPGSYPNDTMFVLEFWDARLGSLYKLT